ncbi:MAG: carboxypeptidase regulatory-like domain-containing protein, partial [Acidobacteriales bacterium]
RVHRASHRLGRDCRSVGPLCGRLDPQGFLPAEDGAARRCGGLGLGDRDRCPQGGHRQAPPAGRAGERGFQPHLVQEQGQQLDAGPWELSLRPHGGGVLDCHRLLAPVSEASLAAVRGLRPGRRGGLFQGHAFLALPIRRRDGSCLGLLHQPLHGTPVTDRLLLKLLLLLLGAWPCLGQLTTGVLRGRVLDEAGTPRPGVSVTVEGQPASRIETLSDANGEFELVLPYGSYRLSAGELGSAIAYVRPLQTTSVDVRPGRQSPSAGSGLLLALEPATVAYPLDFSGLAGMRLPLVSLRAYSWTATRFTLQGAGATDAYQPGRVIFFPDAQAAGDLVSRSGFDLGSSPAYGSEIAWFAREPERAWHGRLSTSGTGSLLAWGNLPSPAARGILQQSERYRWLAREGFQAGGPLGRRADLMLSGSGQWASQTVPQAPARQDLDSRLLFTNARGRVQFSERDQIDGLFSGSRIRLSDWGVPAGLEALVGRRMSPPLANASGFAGLREADRFDSMRAGWTRQTFLSGRPGALEVRYGFSSAHLETTPTGAAGTAPPLANRATRTGHDLQVAFQPGEFSLAGQRHRLSIGGG